MKKIAIVVILLLLISRGVLANGLPIPHLGVHDPFLLGKFKSGAPSLVVFKDPFCQYCLKALENRSELSNYNVYLFWYPIFGDRSDARVKEFFKCDAPAGNVVIEAVLKHASPKCDGVFNERSFNENNTMYQAYKPDGVPAFYLDGKKVSLNTLIQFKNSATNEVVRFDWTRYRLNAYVYNSVAKNTVYAIYLPKSFINIAGLEVTLERLSEYNWYLFQDADSGKYSTVCKLQSYACDDKLTAAKNNQTAEWKLLMGLEEKDNSKKIQVFLNGMPIDSPSAVVDSIVGL